MKEPKSWLAYFAEMIEPYRADRQQMQAGTAEGTTDKPNKLSRLTRWFLPVGITVVTVVLLIGTQSLWLTRFRSPTATSPKTIPYQGRLTDPDGMPLTGEFNMAFAIYDAPTGGTPLWQEDRTGENSVEVSDGLVNVMLGSINNTLASAIAGYDELYLGIAVGSDSEMTPRVPLGSVPFSFQAQEALTVSDGSVTTEKIADGAVTTGKLNVDNGLEINGDLSVAGSIKGSYLCCGHTNTDGTGWLNYKYGEGIYIDVDTSGCNFPATPMYFTSLSGASRHWTANGVSTIYYQSATSFRIYLSKTGVTPAEADTYDWHIQWCGIKQKTSGIDTGSP